MSNNKKYLLPGLLLQEPLLTAFSTWHFLLYMEFNMHSNLKRLIEFGFVEEYYDGGCFLTESGEELMGFIHQRDNYTDEELNLIEELTEFRINKMINIFNMELV